MSIHEQYKEKIIEITFIAFGDTRQRSEFLYDCTIEQASNYVWKICPTAIILFAWEYNLNDPKQLPVKKKKLDDNELNKFYKKL